MPSAQSRQPPAPVTRLAPSPTGTLHLGNARTFMINWAMARQRGWRVLLRIEDLNTPRTKPDADQQAIEDLRWLGMDWDDGPVYQTSDLGPYRAAIQRLGEAGLVYPCRCTRKEIEAASAPHEDEHELRYPGTCRDATPRESVAGRRWDTWIGVTDDSTGPAALRLVVPDEDIAFHDERHGPQATHVQRQVGDFVLVTKAGLPSYQLAVVVDDLRQGVTDVVRSDDLLPSTARQVLLYRLLRDKPGPPGQGTPPRWWHLPLVRGADGRRLAKRHGDSRLAGYREAGVAPERVIGLLGSWCGIESACHPKRPMSAAEFLERFTMERLPKDDITFQPEDDAWLRAKD